MKAPRLRPPTWALFRIAERDGWTCHICGQRYLPGDDWEIDHDVPLAKGGTNHIANLRLAHASCNNAKASA